MASDTTGIADLDNSSLGCSFQVVLGYRKWVWKSNHHNLTLDSLTIRSLQAQIFQSLAPEFQFS